jgi:hypothetical protein
MLAEWRKIRTVVFTHGFIIANSLAHCEHKHFKTKVSKSYRFESVPPTKK